MRTLKEICDACISVWPDLLEVGSEAVHVLIIGQHGVSLSVEEVDVPDAKQSQQDWSVLFQRCSAEMVVLQRSQEFTFMYSGCSLQGGSCDSFFYTGVMRN